jgi:hypothetical protein
MGTYLAIQEKRIGMGMEGTYGVMGSLSRLVAGEITPTFSYDSQVRANFGGQTHNVQTYKREKVLGMSVNMSADPASIGEIMSAYYGTHTTATMGTGALTAYKHTFTHPVTISDNYKSACAKIDFGAGQLFDYTGLRVNTLNFTCEAKGDLMLSAEMIGKNRTAGTAIPATVLYGTYAPWIFSQCTVTMAGTSYNPKNISIEGNKGLSEGFRIGTDNTTIRPLPSQKAETHVKFTLDIDVAGLENFYMNGTNQYVNVLFQGDALLGTMKTELSFNMPNVSFLTRELAYNDGLYGIAFDGMVLEGTNANGTGNVITYLQNGLATI